MAFQLPKYHELTDDQRKILNVPNDRNMIVQGPPGSGKSVLAIYKASNLAAAGTKTLLLMFNNPLRQYTKAALASLRCEAQVYTYHAWLWSIYESVPQSNQPRKGYDWDFQRVAADFQKWGFGYDHILVDEAQDFPEELLRALTIAGKNISLFMDDQQQIGVKKGASVKQALRLLGVKAPHSVSENFRNTIEILEFAKLYQSEADDEFEAVRHGSKPNFVQCGSDEARGHVLGNIIRNNSTGMIGVFADDKSEADLLAESIEKEIGPKPEVFKYSSSNQNLDFEKPGVYVVPLLAMKGLEFDTVVLPHVEQMRVWGDATRKQNTFYVAATRAKRDLYCLYGQECAPGPDHIDVFGQLSSNRNMAEWIKWE